MRKYQIITALLFISCCSLGQSESRNTKLQKMTETDSLYLIALEKYTVELDNFYYKYSKEKKPGVIFLESDEYLSKIPDSIAGYRIQEIGIENRKRIFRENGNKLKYVKVFPLTLEKGQFSISLIPYNAELNKKNNLLLGLSDWTIVFFKFENKRLIYEKTESGGI